MAEIGRGANTGWVPLAEKGNAKAQELLGRMYATGKGVEKDNAESLKWYRLAALQGSGVGQHNLGIGYAIGAGKPKDYLLAYMWGTVALENGFNESSKIHKFLADKMTPADISEAQRRARDCMASNYQDCD